jgi:hypothetical protein
MDGRRRQVNVEQGWESKIMRSRHQDAISKRLQIGLVGDQKQQKDSPQSKTSRWQKIRVATFADNLRF